MYLNTAQLWLLYNKKVHCSNYEYREIIVEWL